MTKDDPLSHSLLLPAFLSGRLHVAEHEDAVDRHGGAPALPARRPPDPRLPPPLPLPHLLAVLPLEQTGMQMRQVPLDRDINIAGNGCFGFATSAQKGPFTAMLI